MSAQVIWEDRNKKIAKTTLEAQEKSEIEEEQNLGLQNQTLASLGITLPKTGKKTPTGAKSTEIEEKKTKPLRGKLFKILGNFLIIISLSGLGFTFYPIAKVEIAYRIGQIFGQRFQLNQEGLGQTEKTNFGELLGKPAPTILVPKSTDFGIVVEKIGANAPIISNVNAGNPQEYNTKLQRGVAHAAGTKFPGQAGLSFLFAHSVLNPWDVPRYNAVFYLLRELAAGDKIVIFWQGKRFDYLVYDKKIVAPADVGFLYQNYSESILVLQTCDPPGTTWRRLLVFAKLASAS